MRIQKIFGPEGFFLPLGHIWMGLLLLNDNGSFNSQFDIFSGSSI